MPKTVNICVTCHYSCARQREFLCVEDLAYACVHLMEIEYNGPLANIGIGVDMTICVMTKTVVMVVGIQGVIAFDTTKPDACGAVEYIRVYYQNWAARWSSPAYKLTPFCSANGD